LRALGHILRKYIDAQVSLVGSDNGEGFRGSFCLALSLKGSNYDVPNLGGVGTRVMVIVFRRYMHDKLIRGFANRNASVLFMKNLQK